MARIRVLQPVGGVDFSWAPGDVVDLDDEAAAAWADGVRAEAVEESETTAARSRRGGRAPKAETR